MKSDRKEKNIEDTVSSVVTIGLPRPVVKKDDNALAFTVRN